MVRDEEFEVKRSSSLMAWMVRDEELNWIVEVVVFR